MSAGGTPAAGQGGDAGSTASGGSAGTGVAGAVATGGAAGDASTGGLAGTAGSAGTGSSYPGTVIIQDDFDAGSTLDAKWFACPDFDVNQQPKIDTARTHTPPNAITKIGGQNYSGTIGQVWYDDIFAGTEQVGCAR